MAFANRTPSKSNCRASTATPADGGKTEHSGAKGGNGCDTDTVIFQGETSHAQHIGWGVTHALAQIQVQHELPVVHGVFVFDKVKHARVRCLNPEHNRGTEAAHTALEMARVMATLGV